MPDPFDHLRLFRDVVDLNSVSRGAARNGITQSAASQHLLELEARFGVTLLNRATRPFTLTAAGRLYYEMSRDVLARYDAFTAAMNALSGQVEGVVRVAAIYSVGFAGMSELQSEFSRRYPAASVEVEYLRPETIYEKVQQDQADLGLVSYPKAGPDIVATPWLSERMVVAVAPGHPLAKKRKIRPQDLAGVEFVSFDHELPIRRHIDRFLRQHHVEVHQAMHFDSIPMVKEMLALGRHASAIQAKSASRFASILPERIMQEDIRQGRLRAIPLTVDLRRPLGIVRRKRKQLTAAAERFLALLTES